MCAVHGVWSKLYCEIKVVQKLDACVQCTTCGANCIVR
jgi:heterodisulfide reductase subunit C